MSQEVKPGPEGMGGWLILPLLGLIITPLRCFALIFTDLLPVFKEGHWEALTTPGYEAYHPLWAPLIIGELVGNIAIGVFSLVILVFFFRRSIYTPTLVIAWLGISFIFVLGDYLIADHIPFIAEIPDPESAKEIVRAAIAALIWIPYFLVSKRVKATFTR